MRFPRSRPACGAGLRDRRHRLDNDRLSWRIGAEPWDGKLLGVERSLDSKRHPTPNSATKDTDTNDAAPRRRRSSVRITTHSGQRRGSLWLRFSASGGGIPQE